MPEATNARDWPTFVGGASPDPLHIEFAMLFDSLADETGDTQSVKALNQ